MERNLKVGWKRSMKRWREPLYTLRIFCDMRKTLQRSTINSRRGFLTDFEILRYLSRADNWLSRRAFLLPLWFNSLKDNKKGSYILNQIKNTKANTDKSIMLQYSWKWYWRSQSTKVKITERNNITIMLQKINVAPKYQRNP